MSPYQVMTISSAEHFRQLRISHVWAGLDPKVAARFFAGILSMGIISFLTRAFESVTCPCGAAGDWVTYWQCASLLYSKRGLLPNLTTCHDGCIVSFFTPSTSGLAIRGRCSFRQVHIISSRLAVITQIQTI